MGIRVVVSPISYSYGAYILSYVTRGHHLVENPKLADALLHFFWLLLRNLHQVTIIRALKCSYSSTGAEGSGFRATILRKPRHFQYTPTMVI